VGVNGRGQAEMARIRRVVTCWAMVRSIRKREGPLHGGARRAVDQVLEVPRLHGAGRRAEAVAQRRDEGIEDLDLRGSGAS